MLQIMSLYLYAVHTLCAYSRWFSVYKKSVAAREADFDEHRADVRSCGCNGHDHREYDYRS